MHKLFKLFFINYIVFNFIFNIFLDTSNWKKMNIQKWNFIIRISLLAVQLIIIALTLGLIVTVIGKRKCKVLFVLYIGTIICYYIMFFLLISHLKLQINLTKMTKIEFSYNLFIQFLLSICSIYLNHILNNYFKFVQNDNIIVSKQL